MDYEKKYKEALKRAKRMFSEKELNYLFPELKESEDERIRKEIEQLIQCMHDADPRKERWLAWLEKQKVLSTEEEEDKQGKEYVLWCIKQAKKYAKDENEMGTCWLAEKWLEKQGKQNPANKVEPKFHEGDWIVDSIGIAHKIERVIENVTNNTFGYDIVGGGYFNDDSDVHLWTIQDAKAGDVLTNKHSNTICIFKRMKPLHCDLFDSYCELHDNKHFGSGFDFNVDGFEPATKEQRALLFQNMKEAGYEWDAKKKELKKVEE